MEYHSGIIIVIKLLIHTTTWINLLSIVLSEKIQPQRYLLYNSTYLLFLKNLSGKQIKWLPVLRTGGGMRRAPKGPQCGSKRVNQKCFVS